MLTAGHVSGQPGTNAFVILQNGKRLKAKSLGRNGGIDSGMMQILEGGPFPHVDMGSSADMKTGQWCVCVGHPGGLKLNRGLVVRVGRVLFASNSFFAPIVIWSAAIRAALSSTCAAKSSASIAASARAK